MMRAWEQINQAMRLDPASHPPQQCRGSSKPLYYARDYDRAVEHGQKALQLNPDYYRNAIFWLGRVYAQKGLYGEGESQNRRKSCRQCRIAVLG